MYCASFLQPNDPSFRTYCVFASVCGREFDEHILHWTPGTNRGIGVKRNVVKRIQWNHVMLFALNTSKHCLLLQNCFESAAKYLEWFGPLVLCEMHACMSQIFSDGVPNGVSKHRDSGSDRTHATPEVADYSAVLEVCWAVVESYACRAHSHHCIDFVGVCCICEKNTFQLSNHVCRLGPRMCPKCATLVLSVSASVCSPRKGVHSMRVTCCLWHTKMMPPPFGAKLVEKFENDPTNTKLKSLNLAPFTTALLVLS